MNAVVISIGNELLNGYTVNTNASYISQKLYELGFQVIKIITIPDKKEEIKKTIEENLIKTDLIICTGGLGPTSDDITKQVLCEIFESRLIFINDIWEHIQELFRYRNLPIADNNRNQAEVPDNAIILKNHLGTAPGLLFNKNDHIFIALPGVPFEMKQIFEEEIIPFLKHHFKIPEFYVRTLKFSGISESLLAKKIEHLDKLAAQQGINIAFLPRPEIITLKLTCKANEKQKTQNIEQIINEIRKLVGEYLYAEEEISLAEYIGKLLKEKNQWLCTAESCTGGNIAHLITSVPGSSMYFKGSIVAYSNEVKTNILQVPEKIIQTYGAVSQPVVEFMAKGALHLLQCDYAIAVSGIAGPDGGSSEKPVGTTWIAVASKNHIQSKKFIFGTDRLINIERSSLAALNMLRHLIKNYQ
jgi:nicotinamide-nucleotide amidase